MRPLRLIPDRQRGVVLVLFTVGMLAIIAVAGLALDMGYIFLNKTRLQNALDAGALSGARTLSDSAGVTAAQAAALATFNLHLTGEMGAASPALVPTFQFSATLIPFVPGANDATAKFIRLRVPSFSTSLWLAYVVPGVGNTLAIGGSAVAGPSPPVGGSPGSEVCDILPFVVCAGQQPGGGYDTDCSDGSCFGYAVGATTETCLKTGTGGAACGASGGGGGGSDWEVGPGNYRLLRLNCGSGADCVRDNLAGQYSGCVINGGSVPTEPGATVGPVAQGLNTRFNIFNGPMRGEERNYPPDVVTSNSPIVWYSDYLTRLNNKQYDVQSVQDGGFGVPMRRVAAVVFGNCTGNTNGAGTIQVVGVGCYFLTRPAQQSGQQRVYGQFVNGCSAAGTVAEDPGSSSVANTIVLYKDPDGGDS